MSAFLTKILNDDFMWDALVAHLPRYRRSNTNYYNFNCPMCMDYKPRCGVTRTNRIGINCYNCSFTAGYKVGGGLSRKLRDFLQRIGLTDMEIAKLNHQALVVRRALESATQVPEHIEAITFEPQFERMDLPDGSMPLMKWADEGCTDPNFLMVVEYAMKRGDVLMKTADWHWSPLPELSKRIIIPFRWRGTIVGFTARAADDHPDKYLNFMPQNFLFNAQAMDRTDRDFVLLIEGPTDALAIDGVSPLGAKLNEKQAAWLKSCGKRIIVVPDRDKQGQTMIDLARKHGFWVAFPGLTTGASVWWDEDVKDCDSAVNRHGRLYTLRSILETATNNGTEIEVKRKYLV